MRYDIDCVLFFRSNLGMSHPNEIMNVTKTHKKTSIKDLGRILLLVTVLTGLSTCTYYHTRSPAKRISYEEKVGREFAMEASGVLRLMDEPEILDFLKAMGHRITDQLWGSSTTYRFFVIRDPTMNAFAVPGGYIYFFAGLMARVEGVDELAGVMAHEIGHVEGNHFIRGQKKLDIANMAAIAATILAATMGGGEHAAAVGTLAQATQLSTALHYSREFEREADRTSIRLAYKAGFNPEGSLSLFKTFQSQSRLNASDLPPYFSTHPLPTERIYEVQSWIQAINLPPGRETPIKGFDLARLTARLRTEDEDKLFAEQKEKAKENPQNAHAQFLLGYLYLKRGDLTLAQQYLEKALEIDDTTTEHALYLARARQLAERLEEAGHLLNNVLEKEPANYLAQVFYGDLMLQHDDWESALPRYRKALILNPRSSFAHMSLGMAYGRENKIGNSYFQLGMADKCAGRYMKALYYFKKALKNLPPKSKEALAIKEEIHWFEG